ncbi:MAG: translation initiation factor IF-2 [Candidatus Babeliales bacterium]
MRIYEVAKLLNISNKELLEILERHGMQAKSHMSTISQDDLDKLNVILKEKKQTPSKIAKDDTKPKRENQIEKSSQKVEKVEKIIEKKELKREPEDISRPAAQPPEFIVKPMTLGEIAEKINKPVSELIVSLLKQGVVCTKNQLLSEKLVEQLATSYGFSISYPKKEKEETKIAVIEQEEGFTERLPIVVVLGHVDHGKTTLLDFIRKTKVALKEKGGITQHLGAYEAETPQGNVICIDTPGHEAFSNIRGRGVKVADLAIIVVAADDSVMPQTVEAIKKAQDANIPIIVAINKMDKVDSSRLEVIRTDLARYNVLVEEWGGDVIAVPISAKTGDGVDRLLEMVVLQSQLMDLKADLERPASGFVLESRLEKGLGPVATIICQHGILHIGDYFAAGYSIGKATSIIDSYGKRIKKVGPSIPVQIAGFSELPHAGDFFEVISQEKYRKLKNSKDARVAYQAKYIVSDQAIKLIVKTDNSSSQEALLTSLNKLSSKMKKEIYIVHSGIGDITESDVVLATNTGAMIVGLHIKIESNAIQIAQKNIVRIMLFDIIYKLLEHIESIIKAEEPVKMVSKKIGEAVIRKVFQIKNIGVIAGAYVKDGRFAREGRIIAWRGKEKIGEGPIKSLEREKRSVKEVHAGFECAFLVEGIDDWQVDDRAECYINVPESK